MSAVSTECDELRVSIERLRTLLENLIVRGLRACGPDELVQLKSHAEYLERAGAGHVGSILAGLHDQIEKDDRASARTLLKAQTSVRLLERLLTLKVVAGRYQFAVEMLDGSVAAPPIDDMDALDDEPEA
jgi:hypothetical protein